MAHAGGHAVNAPTVARPWYREPFVWLILGIPGTAVLMGIAMVVLAVRSDDGLVVDDYYRQGLAINRELRRDEIAEHQGLEAVVRLERSKHRVEVQLTARAGFSYPDDISLRFLHSTRAGFDTQTRLHRQGAGAYRGTLPELVPGRWHLLMEADDWRLLESLTVR